MNGQDVREATPGIIKEIACGYMAGNQLGGMTKEIFCRNFFKMLFLIILFNRLNKV
jgi:hypothetical protein